MALVNVLIIGAGEINFGSVEGPWNHSLRLERALGARLNVLGVIDPDTSKATQQLRAKTAKRIDGYARAVTWSSLSDALPYLRNADIDLGILGIPPHCRGTTKSPADTDLQLLEKLPHVKRWLVEKPISAAIFSPENGQVQVAQAWERSPAVVAVGYHMTALKGVLMLAKIIKDKKLTVMATQARYNMAYEYARKLAWWNVDQSCGPVVEQATHLANLSLLFGGSADLGTVRTHTVEHSDAPGQLIALRIDESQIPSASRIPRYTSAVWKYASGAVGSLSHSVALHGTTYDTDFTVICDGHIFKLSGFYSSSPQLEIREDGKAEVEIISFANDDPYQTQIDALLTDKPTCTYNQGMETYALTWAIRLAGETEREQRRKTHAQPKPHL